MMSWTSLCEHTVTLNGPYCGNHLGDVEIGPHPRCVPMDNRPHFHGECEECGASVVVDAAYVYGDINN